MSVVFAAWEAGAAGWMAPLWKTLQPRPIVYLGPAAWTAIERRGATPPGARRLDSPHQWPADASVIVASATGRAEELAALAQARRLDLRVLQVIDNWDNYAARFPDKSWPDRIAVIDDAARTEAIAAGLPADRVIALGHPGWEKAQVVPLGDPAAALFVGQPIAARRGRTLGYDERDAWNICMEACARGRSPVRSLMYLSHPEETDPPGSPVSHDPQAALAKAGIVIGMFSAFMVEAVLAGRRVISVQPGLTAKDPCGLSRHGRIPLATNVAALGQWLAHPTAAAFGDELAGSTARAVAAIEELAA